MYVCIHMLFSLLPQTYRGSVKPFVNFNAKQDAELLHKAMKGIGQFPDETVIKSISLIGTSI